MAIERTQDAYYNDNLSKWIDIHLSVKCCLEKFLAQVLFKGDYSRICYSQLDNSFRRRLDTLSKGRARGATDSDKLNPISLNMPFATYCQTSDWEDDDRDYAMNASQAVLGIYDLTTYKRLRSMACKSTYTVNVFFNRRDDLRMAQQLLFWEKSPKTPIYMFAIYNWQNTPLAIPVYISIEKINTTPQYNEMDFLTKHKIYSMEVEMTVRSYQVCIPNINNVYKLPYRFDYNLESDYGDGHTMYVTEESVLEFINEKWGNDIDTDKSKVDMNSEEVQLYKKFFETTDYVENALNAVNIEILNNATYDIVKGYFSETTEVDLNYYSYNEQKSTPTTAIIDICVKPADYKYFQKIIMFIPAHGAIEITDCKVSEITIDHLYPSSTYACKILTYSIYGTITTFELTFTTKDDPNNKAPTPEKINYKLPGLIGMHI